MQVSSAVGTSYVVILGANSRMSDNCEVPSAVGTIHVCRDADALGKRHE